MHSKLVTAICFRLLAIYVALRIVIVIPELWMQYIGFMRSAESDPSRAPLWYLGGGALLLLVGLLMAWLLWHASQKVLRDLPAGSDSLSAPQLNGYRLLGCFFLISGLSQLPNQGLMLWELVQQQAYAPSRIIHYLAEPCVLIVAGLCLVIGTSAVLDFLRQRAQG